MKRVAHIFFYYLRSALRLSFFKRYILVLFGLKIGRSTLPSSTTLTWPHAVVIGSGCELKDNIIFHVDGPYSAEERIIINDRVFLGANIEFNIMAYAVIGCDSLIGSSCKFIDHDHSSRVGQNIALQPCKEAGISVGRDVWIGSGTIILKGVTIGDGSIVAANSTVRTNIPPGEVWAGTPAKFVKARK